MYDHSQEPNTTFDLKKVTQFKAVELVKNSTQTECVAYYTTIMQNQNKILKVWLFAKTNNYIGSEKKVTQFKGVEMVKKLIQTECLAYYTSTMQKQNK